MKRMQRPLTTLLMILLSLALTLSVGISPASAVSGSETVDIPVTVHGKGCTVKLTPVGNSNPAALVDIPTNATRTLNFVCTGELNTPYDFRLRVIDFDTETIDYDDTEYTVTVMLYAGGYTIVASTGETGESGKPISLSFTNKEKDAPPVPVTHDPPVRKVIDGIPEVPSTFVFTFTRNNIFNPMPEGSIGGQKQMSVVGAGFAEFGDITFTKPGVYEYTIAEKNTGDKGYDYDPAVYLVRYDVVDAGGYLTCERTFFKDGEVVTYLTAATFTNKYEKPEEPTPGIGGGDDPTPGPGPGPDDGSGAGGPGDDTTPPPPDVHDTDTPKTGDDSHLALWTYLAVGSFGCALVMMLLLAFLRKEREARNDA